MYDADQMNSLYFYPHKLRFSPVSDAADNEQRNRWFPGYDASAVVRRAKAPPTKSVSVPEADSQDSDRDRQDVDDAHMEDEGAPHAGDDHGND